MDVALQELLVMHLRGKVTNPRMVRLRERARKHISKGGHVPADDEIEEEIDNVLVAKHRKGVKDLVAKAIAYVYWTCLREYLQKEFGITKAEVGKALDVSSSNLNRWGKETLPDPSKSFLALVWRNIDVRAEKLKFPPHHERFRSFDLVIAEATTLALEQIRVREFGKKYAKLTIPMLACARTIYKHGDSDAFALGTPAALKRRRAIMHYVTEKLGLAVPRDSGVDEEKVKKAAEEMVEKAASEWLLSYALFDLGRPKWDFLREE